MIAAVQLKRRVTSTCVLRIVISKLGYWQEPSPVILLKVDKDLEVHFHCAVLLLGLPICLRMDGGKEPSLDAEKVAK